MTADAGLGPIFVVCAVRRLGDPVPDVEAEDNVAILNDDIEPKPELLELLADGLRYKPEIWISYPDRFETVPYGHLWTVDNEHFAGQTMTGWAFMLRGETGLRFDTRFRWWYGDT